MITEEYLESVKKECLNNLIIDHIYLSDGYHEEVIVEVKLLSLSELDKLEQNEEKVITKYFNKTYVHSFVYPSGVADKLADILIRNNAYYLMCKIQDDITEHGFKELYLREFYLNISFSVRFLGNIFEMQVRASFPMK